MRVVRMLTRVPSLSDQRVLYDLFERDGVLFCSCQAFSSWRKRGLPCWHMRVYESATRAIARCRSVHGTADGFVCRPCLLALLSAMAGKVKQHYVDKEIVRERLRARRKKSTPKRKPKHGEQ